MWTLKVTTNQFMKRERHTEKICPQRSKGDNGKTKTKDMFPFLVFTDTNYVLQ